MWMLKRKKFDGQVFGAYLILYGVARYFLEFLRDDPGTRFGVRRNHDRNAVDLDWTGDAGRSDLVAAARPESRAGASRALNLFTPEPRTQRRTLVFASLCSQ